ATPPRAAILTMRKSPFLAMRGDSLCLTLEKGRLSAVFYDTEFWKRYLDTLARARYNTLDLQAGIDLATGDLVNGFALFTSPPEFPEAKRDLTEVRRDMQMLRQIVDLARDRSIRVMLTSRALEAAVPAERQPRYVAQAIARLYQAVPGLGSIGL